ncbi:MAG: hypothetical protein Q8873_04445 [Bacillota bacterium]|nr:hypothetical protein [Bacillota bacterium]
MFKSRLEGFIAKRTVVYLAITVIAAMFFKDRWYIACGLSAGAFFSAAKFAGYAWGYRRLTEETSGNKVNFKAVVRNIIIFVVSQLITITLLFEFYFYNVWLFGGFVAGLMAAPAILVVNSVTEVLGITKNNFFL